MLMVRGKIASSTGHKTKQHHQASLQSAGGARPLRNRKSSELAMPFPPCGPPEAAVVEEVSAARKAKAVPAEVKPSPPKPKAADGFAASSESTRAQEQARNPFLVILTAEQARSIYSLRSIATAEGKDAHLVAGKSSLVAEIYGVSPKTIRDVWNRKTWTQVTRSLWSEQEADLYSREHMTPEQRAALGDTELYLKRRGRPPGSKDARPRKRRFQLFEDAAERPQDDAMFVEELKSLDMSHQPNDTEHQAELMELHGPCDRSVIPGCGHASSEESSNAIPEPSFADSEEAEPSEWPMQDDSESSYQPEPQSCPISHEPGNRQPYPAQIVVKCSLSPEFADEQPGPPSEDFSSPPPQPHEISRSAEHTSSTGENLSRTPMKKEPMAMDDCGRQECERECDSALFSYDENWFPGAALADRERSDGSMHMPMSPSARPAQLFGENSGGNTSWEGSTDPNEAVDGIDDFWFVLYGHHRAPSPTPAAQTSRYTEDEEDGRLFAWCGGGA